jgi:beta-glucosidase
MLSAVKKGDIPQERIDDAVRRILRVKFILGLFERPFVDANMLKSVGSDENRALARQAVAKSLVLLQNENQALPLSKTAGLVFVAGEAADDIGMQCGGWTIEWQGKIGDITDGTTILQGIKSTVALDTEVVYNPFGNYERLADENGEPVIAPVGIVVIGERPYAEGEGDRADLALSETEIELIQRVRERSQSLILILISGRPLIITEVIDLADAIVAAWLPGSEGQGIADVLFGQQPFSGKLPHSWPRNMEQVPLSALQSSEELPLFPLGYGLTYP